MFYVPFVMHNLIIRLVFVWPPVVIFLFLDSIRTTMATVYVMPHAHLFSFLQVVGVDFVVPLS